MAKFNRDNRSGGDFKKPGFNRGGSGFGGRPAKFQAVCSQCGKNCEVPFKPTGEKPVFCNDCFRAKRDQGAPRGFDRSRFADHRPAAGITREQFDALNAKLDKILKILSPVAAVETTIEREIVEVKKAVKKASKKIAESKKPAKKKK